MSSGTETAAWEGRRGAKWHATLAEMEAMLAPVNEPLCAALELERARRVADVGCGGGATTFALAARLGAATAVEGVDVSAELIAEARRLAHDPRVTFTHADAAAFVPAARFDRIASRFGVMFFDAPGAAFANLARWLTPGGRFAFAVWGPASENAWFETVRDVVALHAPVPPIVDAAPGPFRYGDGATLAGLLERAGFVDVQLHPWRGLLPLGADAPAAAAFALGSFGSFAELLASAGARAPAERELAERLRAHVREGAVRLGASVRIATGAVR